MMQICSKSIMSRSALLGLAWMLGSSSLSAQAIPEELIEELRRVVTEAVDQESLGAGYAAMINFAVAPDISTANYDIDNGAGDKPELAVARIPARKVFSPFENGWTPFIQGNLTYQTLNAGFTVSDTDRIDSEWKAYGGSVSVGAQIPINDQLVLVPVLDAGLIRLKNSADYFGDFSNLLLRPALAGVLFDWKTDAWTFGASLGFDYDKPVKNFDLKVHGSLTHHYVESRNSSSPLINFSNHMTTFNIQAETEHPTSKSISGYPLALVAHLGSTSFLGGNRDALGFDHFFDAGLALDADISGKGWKVKNLRLGAKIIAGKDVSGWGLILGYRY